MATVRRQDSGIGGPSVEPAWHGFVAGCIAGASGVAIGHSFDTAKVRSQVGKSMERTSVLSLYRGILPPLLTTGATRAFYFGVYESTKPHIAHGLNASASDLQTVFVAGGVTGAITAPFTAPIQRVKLVQQVEGGSLGVVVRRLIASGTLARGLGLHCLLETVGSACYLGAYAVAMRAGQGYMALNKAPAGEDHNRPPLALRILSGMCAGIVGWISIYPLDVLRSRVLSAAVPSSTPQPGQQPGSRPRPPHSPPSARQTIFQMSAAAARDVYTQGGALGFFRGIGFTLLRAAPVAGTVLPVYDAGKAWLAGTRLYNKDF
jgi:solute carrier family 25 carnitine/acylcarnitine transporter 20/29